MYLLIDALKMIRDIRTKGVLIDLWGALLNIPQFIGGLVFISSPEGRVIPVTLIATLVVAGQIDKRTPFSRLIGICHLPWLLMLPWLVYRLSAIDHPPALDVWLKYVAATVAISLVFDAADLYRYARGDRSFSWSR